MDKSGGSEGKKSLKKMEKEDLISDLPDSVLHHILSFLPSTKEAIQTSVLSKRWLHQWTRVPNLIFDFSGMSSRNSAEKTSLITSTISEIIDHILPVHDCSKIQKFHFISDYYDYKQDPNHEAQLRFIVRKQAEELILRFSVEQAFKLPDFFFRQACLVKLQLFCCSIEPAGMINFESLKDLYLEFCTYNDEAMRSIVSGSPLLESLEVKFCYGLTRLAIALKSLKRLVLLGVGFYVDISCPNLVEFEIMPSTYPLCGMVLKKILSESPLLESLVLKNSRLPNLRIDSKILRKIVLENVISLEIEISCPHLEELGLSGAIKTIRLVNLPSSACVALNLIYKEGCNKNVAKQILEQLQHLNELKLQSSFIEALSALGISGTSYPLLNIKSLTLEGRTFGPIFEHNPGIVFALRCSPVLERLVVTLQPKEHLGQLFYLEEQKLAELSDMDQSIENYWNSNGSRFNNLVSHLRIVEINGFSQILAKPKLVLDFVEFILKNASVLEKLVFTLSFPNSVILPKSCGNFQDHRTDFVSKVSQKVLSFTKCSPSALVEVLCSNYLVS